MARISLLPLKEKTRGLWVSGPRERTLSTFLRRNQGTHLLREREIRSRNGTTADAQISAAHSLTKFNDIRFQGAGTILYRNGVTIDTGYDGTPLEFSVSEPRTGTDAEYLFVSGGGKLRKVDTSGTDTQWGIDPPDSGDWGASVGGAEEAETATTVVAPQEKTMASTGSTSGWFTVGDTRNLRTVEDPIVGSGSMVCVSIIRAADEEEISAEGD